MPFGAPSDKIIIGAINGVNCVFFPRHGRGHTLSPSEINHKANMYALKFLDVEQIVSFTARGSLKEMIKPKDFIIPNQFLTGQKQVINFFLETA